MHEPLSCLIEETLLQAHPDCLFSSFVLFVASQSNIRRFYRSGAGITCLSITYRPRQAISFHHSQLLDFWCYSYYLAGSGGLSFVFLAPDQLLLSGLLSFSS